MKIGFNIISLTTIAGRDLKFRAETTKNCVSDIINVLRINLLATDFFFSNFGTPCI